MESWQLEFIDSTSQTTDKMSSGIGDVLGSGVSSKPNIKRENSEKDKKTFSSEFTKKIEDDTLKMSIISPLNKLTGGLASPIYRASKRIESGASIGSVLGGLGATFAVMAIQTGIKHLQNRLQKVEEEVTRLNNADNVMIRAGSVSKATYYSTSWGGFKVKTNRS